MDVKVQLIYKKNLINQFQTNYKSESDINNFRKINLFCILHYFVNRKADKYSDLLKYSLNLINNQIFSILYNNKLTYCHLIDRKLFLLSRNLTLVSYIELKDLNKIGITGRYSLTLKFFPNISNDERMIINLKFFSPEQRNDIVNEILQDNKFSKYLKNIRYVLFKILEKKPIVFLNQLIIKTLEELRENEMLYYKGVYDLFTTIKTNNYDYFVYKMLIFIFSRSEFVEKVFNLIFFNLINIKYDIIELENMYYENLLNFRTHRDSVDVELRKRGIKKNISDNNNKNRCKSSRSNSSNTSNTNIELESKYNIKSRPRHNDLRRSNSNVNFGKKSMIKENFKLTKPLFDRIIFNVTIPKYFGKGEKILEINNSGFFTIYKKGTNDNFLSYTIEDIVQLEGDSSSTILNITTMIKEGRKIISIDFNNPYEKYVFKTIIHNYLLLSMPRHISGNQLKLNTNIMSWNVAGIDVPSDLILIFNSQSFEGIDIFAIGVQECSIFKIKDWQKHLKTLITYYGFEEVTSINMCQMFLIVFIKSDLKPFIENVSSGYKPMGFAKVIGNKGGIVISFKLLGYQLTFVNCHLAPKVYKVLERNNHAKNLIKSVRIGEKFAEFDILADYLFWHGDLNYRVDYNFDETVAEIKKNNLKLLLAKDQLIKQKQDNKVFYDFQEPEINFFPTYRRIKGTDEYSNKQNQSPSWCDRIMVKTTRDLDILFYDSLKSIKNSDHLPVLGKFCIYLTLPSFDDVDKTLNQNVAGKFIYSNLGLSYDFTEALSELDIEPKFPLKIKLSTHLFINKISADSKSHDIKNFSQLQNYKESENINFDDISLNFPPQFLFDLPHARALNIFFVITLIIGKTSQEIGFAKYCLESIEKENSNLLLHDGKLDVTWRTRKFGTLTFTATYKF